MPSRTQLETAAAGVIRILKGIGEYSNARIAIIGGLALWRYIPTGRTTEVNQRHTFSECTRSLPTS